MGRILLSAMLCLLACSCATQAARDASAASATDLEHDRILVTVDDNALHSIADLSPSGRLAYLPPANDVQQRKRGQQLADAFDLEMEENWPIPALGVHCFVFRIPDPAARTALLAALAAHPDVESVQPLNFFETRGEPLLDGNGEFVQRLDAAHRVATGKSVGIVVIDAGADLDHEDLDAANITAIDLVGDGDRVPAEFHGTAVVGVIAAQRNGKGILGYAPDARILLLRACWQTDVEGEQATCNSFTLAKALSYALESDASIVNMSISGPRDPLLERIAALLPSRGMLLVAAGDSREEFPASAAQSVLASRLMPDARHGFMTLLPHDRYALRSGSSLSAARVSGVAALMLDATPQLALHDLQQRLLHMQDASGAAAFAELLQTASPARSVPVSAGTRN